MCALIYISLDSKRILRSNFWFKIMTMLNGGIQRDGCSKVVALALGGCGTKVANLSSSYTPESLSRPSVLFLFYFILFAKGWLVSVYLVAPVQQPLR